jgi:hypothetical protein
MAEEMIVDSWESDEAYDDAYDGESDEAFAEAEDSAEDYGEATRRRRRSRKSHYRPVRQGVRGVTVRGQDGRARQVQFPAKLATAAETNRGLATQEMGRRALEERLDRLETKARAQAKQSSSVQGVVSLAIGAPLAAWGLFKPTQTGGSRFGNWANEETTRMASLTSASQLATTGARMLITGKYARSSVGFAADLFAAAQLAAFTFGQLSTPAAIDDVPDASVAGAAAAFPIGARVLDLKTNTIFEVVGTKSGGKFFV